MGARNGLSEPGRGRQLESLIEALREGFVLCRMIRDAEGRVIDYIVADGNAAYLRSLGGRSAIGQRLLKLRPELSQQWFDTCGAILEAGKAKRLEYWDPTLNRWFDTHMTPVGKDELIMLYVDVTHRKTAETQAQERLRELNHRVKNNLNLVAATLSLQARGASAETRAALNQAVARVHTISEVHNLLHKTSATDTVSLDAYLGDLCRKLQRSLTADRVAIVLEADRIQVTIEHAVELGVVVNELVTNAVKYAYPESDSGVVEVSAHLAGRMLKLSIRDFGPGVNAGKGEGLGMKLVRSIIRQNGGEMTVKSDGGALVCIRLPLRGPEGEVRVPPA